MLGKTSQVYLGALCPLTSVMVAPPYGLDSQHTRTGAVKMHRIAVYGADELIQLADGAKLATSVSSALIDHDSSVPLDSKTEKARRGALQVLVTIQSPQSLTSLFISTIFAALSFIQSRNT